MGTKLRLLFTLPNLVGAGGQRAVLDMCRGLDTKRFDVHILVQEKFGSFLGALEPTDKVTFLLDRRYRKTDLPRLLSRTMTHVRNADIVIGALEGRASFCGLAAAKLLGKPFVGWVHIDWEPFLKHVSDRQRLGLSTYRWADKIVACSNGAAESFSRLFSVPSEKVCTIYNGLPLRSIAQAAQEPLPPEFVEIFKQPTIVMVGRLDPQKNYPLLLDAHARLAQSGIAAQLVIVGDGGLRDELRAQAERLGTSASVHFAGFRLNPQPFIKNARLFALSSLFEGFGLVLVEAMMNGTPIVATDCPSGPREVLDNGAYGTLVPSEDPDALAAAMRALLTNRAEAERVAEAGRKRAQAFALEQSCQRWEQLLLGVAHLKPHKGGVENIAPPVSGPSIGR